MLRLFIAVRVPPDVRLALKETQRSLAEGGAALRWTRPEAMHLTLVFIGETPDERVPTITDAMRHAALASPPFSLEARGLGVFSLRGTPRVVWVGLHGDLYDLRTVHGALDGSLRRAGFTLEARPFTPHLTLGRVAQRMSRDVDASIRTRVAGPAASYGAWRVDEIELIKSDLRPSGSVYTTLFTAPLGTPCAAGDPGALRSAVTEHDGHA